MRSWRDKKGMGILREWKISCIGEETEEGRVVKKKKNIKRKGKGKGKREGSIGENDG